MIKGIIPKNNYNDPLSLPVLNNDKHQIIVADEIVLSFLNDLSKKVLKESSFKLEPSFIALGFWLRKKNIKRILSKNYFLNKNDSFIVKPIGKVLHICPSNVDTMFIYSLVLSLLAGNKNIVRISTKLDNIHITKLLEIFNDLISKKSYEIFNEYINVITYDRSDKINKELSLSVDSRIIWGGDETINQFKKYPTKPMIKDLYFTDKVSLSIINIHDINYFNKNFEEILNNIYNDIYTFNQKGCSSPQSLLLVGKNIDKKSIILRIYKGISRLSEQKYNEDISSVALLKFNQGVVDIIDDKISEILNSSNYFTMSRLKSSSMLHSCGAGYLYYDLLDSLDDLNKYVGEKTQTITYLGLCQEDIKSLLNKSNINKVDRIVPIGKALEFDYIWDGYNILLELISFKTIK